MTTDEIQTALGYVKGIRRVLEQVVQADVVLRAALSAEANLGDQTRALALNLETITAQKAEVSALQLEIGTAKSDLKRLQTRARDAEVELVAAQKGLAQAHEAREKAVRDQAADIRAGLDAELAMARAEHDALMLSLVLESDALTAKRDALAAELEALRARFA